MSSAFRTYTTVHLEDMRFVCAGIAGHLNSTIIWHNRIVFVCWCWQATELIHSCAGIGVCSMWSLHDHWLNFLCWCFHVLKVMWAGIQHPWSRFNQPHSFILHGIRVKYCAQNDGKTLNLQGRKPQQPECHKQSSLELHTVAVMIVSQRNSDCVRSFPRE